MDEWIIYIVANTVSPYAYELPLILAYPIDFSYRARFKKEWIDKSLNLNTLSNTRCLILYRDFDSGSLFPIRFGKIINIDKIGEVVHIEYSLKEIIPYHEVREMRHQQLSEFQEEWKRQHPDVEKTNAPKDHMRPLVFGSKFTPNINNPYLSGTESDNEFISWSNTCDLLTELPMYKDIEFIRIVDLKEEFSNKEVTIHKTRHVLRPGKCYKIRIAQRIFKPVGEVIPHNLNLRCTGKGLEGITQHQMAVGKYDIITFRLHTAETRQSAAGIATISGTKINKTPLSIELILEVRPKIPILGLTLTALGCLALLFPEYLIHLTKLGADLTNMVQRIGTIFFVIGIIDSRSILEYVSRD